MRLELTQLSRKLFLSLTCGLQAVTNPSTLLTLTLWQASRDWLYLCLQRMSAQCSNSILYILELLVFSI